MKIIARGRGGGKTYETAQAVLADPNSVLLVFTGTEKMRMHTTYGVPLNRIYTPVDVDHGRLRGLNKKVHIDNADMILRSLLGTTDIGLATFTAELVEYEWRFPKND